WPAVAYGAGTRAPRAARASRLRHPPRHADGLRRRRAAQRLAFMATSACTVLTIEVGRRIGMAAASHCRAGVRLDHRRSRRRRRAGTLVRLAVPPPRAAARVARTGTDLGRRIHLVLVLLPGDRDAVHAGPGNRQPDGGTARQRRALAAGRWLRA